MESSTKMRKGFMKGKLVMSFYRAAKPSNIAKTVKTSHHIPTQIKPTISSQNTTHTPSSLIMNQEKAVPQPKHKVSYAIPQKTGTYGFFDNPYGVVVDEGVDAKAATYISCVQERFKLEHVNTEWVESHQASY